MSAIKDAVVPACFRPLSGYIRLYPNQTTNAPSRIHFVSVPARGK